MPPARAVSIDRIRKYHEPALGAQRRADQADGDRDAGNGISSATSTISRPRGEFVTFDRSWYNRAGVEPVMGFCTPEQHEQFLEEAPKFEQMIVNDGIHFFKFWLNIGQETQIKRFHDRRHSDLKWWKFSPIDVAGHRQMGRVHARRATMMLERTHSKHAPWIVVHANDKRRARLAVIRRILLSIPYDGSRPQGDRRGGRQDHRRRTTLPGRLNRLKPGRGQGRRGAASFPSGADRATAAARPATPQGTSSASRPA